MFGRLSSLQSRVLELLAGLEPAWTLTGGGALVGFYTQHRSTRDLDLFFRDRAELGPAVASVEGCLVAAGIVVHRLQTSPSFVRLRLDGSGESVIVDLVAEPVPPTEAAVEVAPGVLADSQHEILVNKLTCLLSRAEPRDLEDVRVLLEAGGDLNRALRDAPAKDGGFSPLTLAWLLRSFPLETAGILGFDRDRLDGFRVELLQELAGDAPPES